MATTENNYTLGKGEVYLATFKPGTKIPNGFRYIGNTPDFSVKISTKTLDHFSSDRGIREKDQQAITDIERAGSITTDNLSKENIAMFFLGTKNKVTSTAVVVAGEAVSDVVLGHTYILGISDANPMGARGLDPTTVVVKKGATTFDVDVDYVLDVDRATIEPIVGGGIVDGDDLTVDYHRKVATMEGIISGVTPFEGAIFFKATSEVGERIDYLMPWTKINPDGDYNLKSDTWTEMKFSVEVLKATGKEAFYGDGQPVYA